MHSGEKPNMNYNYNEYYLDSESEMIQFLVEQALHFQGSNVAIVAGHYMLMYDELEKKLVPMIWQDSNNKEVIERSKSLAGNFPVDSLKLGLMLFQKYAKLSLTPKIVLAVNDHHFHSGVMIKRFNQDDIPQLKRDYYRLNHSIPNSYLNLIAKFNLKLENVFLKNHKKRNEKEILPSETILFSEQVYRNRFDKYIRPALRKDSSFFEKRSQKGKPNLYFKGLTNSKNFCLTETGECGCSGEVILFVLDLFNKGFFNIIFITPSECSNPVNSGIEVAMYLNSKEKENCIMNIFTINNLGGMGVINKRERDLFVIGHQSK